MACVSFMICRKYGSRWPTVGAPSAANTRGCVSLGPGPMRMRRGGFSGGSLVSGMVRCFVRGDRQAARKQKIEDRGSKIELRACHQAHELRLVGTVAAPSAL